MWRPARPPPTPPSACERKSGIEPLPEKWDEPLKDWFDIGYREGAAFAGSEADYDELAAVHRAGGIPTGWDLYRAEILNRHLGEKSFDFQSYATGFARACSDLFKRL
jgi:hypothetical protein